MKQLSAFMKKEWLEQKRSGRLLLLGALFCLFGMMNPLLTKMLPHLLTLLSDQLEETGMAVMQFKTDALTSWTQFFKNMPIMLLIFLLLFSSILTNEYQRGTLINMITKGLPRQTILTAKMLLMTGFWTLGYLLSFGITYGYNAWFWDNRTVASLAAAVLGFYLIGLWLISVMLTASALCSSASFAALSAGGAYLVSYLLGFLPALRRFVPTFLLKSGELMTGALKSSRCIGAFCTVLVLIVFNLMFASVCFRKRSF